MATTLDVQRRLKVLGFDPGPLDGVLGRQTIAAIKAFQEDRGIRVQFPGTLGPTTLVALELAEPEAEADAMPPWYAETIRRVGLHEQRDNKTLREWLKSDGNTLGDPVKLPWCGDAMETPIALTLPDEPMLANPYWALNWKRFGRPIDIVALGAIAPFSRPGGGHIGQIAGHDQSHFHVVGGNQSNAITISRIEKKRLSGSLRWPLTFPMPSKALPMTTIEATVSTNEA